MVSNLGLNKLEQEQVHASWLSRRKAGENFDEPHNNFLWTQSVRKTSLVLVLVKEMHKCMCIFSICIKFRPISIISYFSFNYLTSWQNGRGTKDYGQFEFEPDQSYESNRDQLNWNLRYAIFSTAGSIVYKYCTRPISRHLYAGIFKDPLDTKYLMAKNRLNSWILWFMFKINVFL